ncbi:MAG: HsdM family class I SAM-dependent methyltransferase [Acidimicrobiales bacterium]
MGSDRLIDWASTAPPVDTPADSLLVLGALASKVAEAQSVDSPKALPLTNVSSDVTAWIDRVPDNALTPDILGVAWEILITPVERRRRGAHFTPREVVDRVCELAVAHLAPSRSVRSVWDPAVGGGAFLLGAARALEQLGPHGREEIVPALSGTDIDPVALRVSDASLELWSGAGARASFTEADALLSESGPFDLIVGNPPFLGQLHADTTRSDRRRHEVAEKLGSATRGYVDEASVFLLRSVRSLSPKGVCTLILPESSLGAAHGAEIRREVAASTVLAGMWIADDQVFDAAVDVVAPILVRDPRPPGGGHTDVALGAAAPTTATTPDPQSWAPLLARRLGVPSVYLDGPHTLGEIADVTAGFRQHFYGIADAVKERGDSTSTHRLVTSGAIDLFRNRFGSSMIRFAGTAWVAPVVELEAIADRRVRDWFADRAVPKILVASQTRVLEALVDVEGSMMPSVPVISVEPHDHSDVWRIAALLGAPAVSADLASNAAGTGLSSGAIRIRAAALADLPIPADRAAWDEGSVLVRDAHEAAACADWVAYGRTLLAFGHAMDRAYGTTTAGTTAWWFERLRIPS